MTAPDDIDWFGVYGEPCPRCEIILQPMTTILSRERVVDESRNRRRLNLSLTCKVCQFKLERLWDDSGYRVQALFDDQVVFVDASRYRLDHRWPLRAGDLTQELRSRHVSPAAGLIEFFHDAFDVLNSVGGVAGGITTVVAVSKRAAAFVAKRSQGQRPSIEDVTAAAADAIEQVFGDRVQGDPLSLTWGNDEYHAVWIIGQWQYDVKVVGLTTGTPVVNRRAAPAPPPQGP